MGKERLISEGNMVDHEYGEIWHMVSGKNDKPKSDRTRGDTWPPA